MIHQIKRQKQYKYIKKHPKSPRIALLVLWARCRCSSTPKSGAQVSCFFSAKSLSARALNFQSRECYTPFFAFFFLCLDDCGSNNLYLGEIVYSIFMNKREDQPRTKISMNPQLTGMLTTPWGLYSSSFSDGTLQ